MSHGPFQEPFTGQKPFSKRPDPPRARDGPGLATCSVPSTSAALKRGVNVCQRQFVNEVLRPLVTEFVRNFGREGATPIQRGPDASLFGRVQAVKLIKHDALRHLMTKLTNAHGLLRCRSEISPGKWPWVETDLPSGRPTMTRHHAKNESRQHRLGNSERASFFLNSG